MSYQDRWQAAADEDRVLGIYVPADAQQRRIVPGSGIVGSPFMGKMRVDFEGNIYDAVNLRAYEERLRCAADRHVTGYPTVARMWLPADELVRVGSYSCRNDEIEIDDQQALDAWLGDEHRPTEEGF